METNVCVIGGGPAGLISAVFASRAGAKTTVIDKNSAVGKKLLLTGGGRCNLTHSGTVDDFLRCFSNKSGRFLRHALYEFNPEATVEFFAKLGVVTKTDEDDCVFPVSDRAIDVRDALLYECRKLNVRLVLGSGVGRIEKQDAGFTVFAGREIVSSRKVIIATGGASCPDTGSTGDGYKLAKLLGHTIIEPKPALVPLVADEKWCADLAGTSLDRVKILAAAGKKKIYSEGAFIFTHDGIGGPAVLDLSRELADYLPASASLGEAGPAEKPIAIFIDILPAMNESELEQYLMSQLSQHSKKIIINVLFDIIPKRLAGFICRQAGVAETIGSQLKKEQRRKVVQLLKKLPLSIKATRAIEEATITRGGVAINEIDAKTMQSKICPGLYFAGEVIDVDGPCGGYNLQICWSTGALAGKI